MSAVSDAQKAAGRLITGKVPGYELDRDTRKLISDGIMSGVTLFKPNASDLEQLVTLVVGLQEAGGKDFVIAVDQEGGAVQRFDHVLSPVPSAMALSALNDDKTVAAILDVLTKQLNVLGVNCNFSPVLDVNSNPLNPIIATRSFGDCPETITRLGRLYTRIHLDNGVLPVGKHFPGHGDTLEDSHLSLALANADITTVEKRELYPFRELSQELPAMLVAHVFLPAYDQQRLPASLSKRISTELLRTQLGFSGFLFTDDLPVMKAIVDNWGLEEASIMAINAGADNLVISGELDQICSVNDAVAKAISDGQISERRVLDALARRKAALASVSARRNTSGPRERLETLASMVESGNELAAAVSAKSIALVRGAVPNIVDESQDWVLIAPQHPRYKMDLLSALSAGKSAANFHLQERRFALNPTPDEIEDVVTFAADKHCLLITYRALLNKNQLQLASRLARVTKSQTVVAADVPYEVGDLPQWTTAFATFDPSDLAMCGLARILNKRAEPLGRSPVVI